MNWLMEHEAEVLHLTLNLRKFVLHSLSDNDLHQRLQPQTQTLGELLLELAHWHNSYAQSFKTKVFRHLEVSSRPHTVMGFVTLFDELDNSLIANLEALSNEDLEQPVNRGTWSIPMTGQFHTFRETVLIFAAKASVYLRAWERPFDQQFQDWIA